MKTELIHLRCTAEQKAVIKESAESLGKTMSAFLLWLAIPSEEFLQEVQEEKARKERKAEKKAQKKSSNVTVLVVSDDRARVRIENMDETRRAQFERSQGLKKYK